jgi:1,2-diacylglycerol 3-alpha-glucosyltransferase
MTAQSRLTVCMFSNLYPPVYSGSSTQCAQLAEELTRQGCRVIVITAHLEAQSPAFEIRNGVVVHRLPCRRLPRLPIALNFPWLSFTFTRANRRRILEILKSEPVDLIHVHNHMFDMALHAVRAAQQLKKPLALTIHTIIRHPNSFFDLILGLADRLILGPQVVRKAHVVICPDHIISQYALNTLQAQNTVLIPYGINLPPPPDPQQMQAIRDKYALGEGPIILSLGHLHEVRNRRELILALPTLRQAYPRLKVLVVGDVGTPSAHELAARLGVLEHLVFTGAVPHSEIQDYIGLADLEAHWFDKSHPHKALGIAAQEAMAAGKVVIGNADENVYGGNILRNGDNVVLIDPTNTKLLTQRIIDLLKEEKIRISMGNKARDTIKNHFSWATIGESTLAQYRMLQISSTVEI